MKKFFSFRFYLLLFFVNVTLFLFYFLSYEYISKKAPKLIDPLTSIVVSVLLLSILFFGVAFSLYLDKKWSNRKRINQRNNEMYIKSWVSKSNSSMCYEFEQKLKISRKKFTYSRKTVPKKIETLKKIILKEIPIEEDLRAWLIYFESRSQSKIVELILSVFGSIGGLTFLFESIPAMYRVLNMLVGKSTNDKGFQFNLDSTILFIIIMMFPLLFVVVCVEFFRNERTRKVYVAILQDILDTEFKQ